MRICHLENKSPRTINNLSRVHVEIRKCVSNSYMKLILNYSPDRVCTDSRNDLDCNQLQRWVSSLAKLILD